MKSILIGLMISMASFLSPTVATGQTGFWTDEGNYDPDWPSVDDIDGNYYNIRNEADLAAFARLVNIGETFKGKIVRVYNEHIDLKEHYWIPIGWKWDKKFEGTFDGMEHRFENVCIDIDQMLTANMDIEDIGFFGNNYGTIKNVSLQSMQIRGREYDRSLAIGGCAVYNKEGAVIENCIIFDDPIKVTEQASLVDIAEIDCNMCSIGIGGICWSNDGMIRKCRNEKPIECSRGNIGGIVYYNHGTLIECENSRSLRSSEHVAGIAQENIGGYCMNNTNTGNISGNRSAGIVWDNCSGTLTDCTNSGSVQGASAAGIVGVNYFYSVPGQQRKIPSHPIVNCMNQGKIIAISDGTNDNSASAGGICVIGDSIYNCWNKGEVSASSINFAEAGGILASQAYDGTIAYCYNTASVSAHIKGSGSSVSNYVAAGGIVGEYPEINIDISNIYNCFNSGDILCESKKTQSDGRNYCGAGGLAGSIYTVISDSYNTGNVLSKSQNTIAQAFGLGGKCTNSFSTGNVNSIGLLGPNTPNKSSTVTYGIGSNPTNCLSLGKNISSTNYAYKVGGNKVEQGNYASSLLKIEDKDGDCSSREGIYENGDHGKFWYLDMAAPLDAWPADAWDKSDNTILPQLKYADGTLMPDQPRLLKSDYATETSTVPADPSDATLKSLSYCFGKDDGRVFPVPGFRPDVFYYQISYDKSLTGSPFYVIAEANNPKATVTTVRNDALGRGFVSVSVDSEDGKESRTYSVFGVETGDEDKCYLVLNLGSHMGDHMTLELNGKAFRGDAVYKAVPGEQIVGKLVPDKGYRLPGEITEFDGFMMGFIQRGETDMYASDGTIRFTLNGHKLLYASAQEGEEPSSPSDATLKSLSYKIGKDGEVIPVPGFRPDVFHYQISYDKSLTGSAFYAIAEANNPKATVDAGGGDLGKRSALILVESEDKSEGGTYSIFGVESGDEDKSYLVFNLGDHLAFLLNGKEFRGNDVYKGVPGEEIIGKLVPDRGYRLPTEISVHDVFMSFIQRGETDLYTYDGTIRLTLDRGTCIYASAQEGEETGQPSVGSKLTDEPFVYEVLPENRLKLLHPTRSSEEWRVSSCDVPASVRYRGVGYHVTEIESNAFEDYTNLKIITLSEGLLSIGAFAFENCGLTRLSLPASVTFIGDEEGDWDLFGDCPNLQAVTVAEGSKTYSASDSILYNKDRSRLILCPPACPHSEVRVPDEVKEIMPYAFADSKNVAGLTLPAGLEKIGEFAFASSALTREKSYIRCLGEQPVTFEDTEFLLLLSYTQEEESYLLASNNGKYPCTLYVPAGTKAAYEAAFFWKNFPITEELPSGDVTISGGDGKIEVEDENGEKVEVEDGVIGNDDLPTVIERISIDIRASSSETTKLVFKQVTVGDGQIVTQETTTTTEIKEETHVSITIEGENVLGKLVNNGIAALLTGSKDGSLSNTVVVNNNTFTSETKLVSKVEGTAPLDVSDPENKTVVAGGSTTLVASTTVESSFNLTFVWERWVDGAWQKVEERKYENLLRSSADKQEDKLTVSAADAGLYRCRITNTVGDVSTTLITTPAEVKLKSSDPDPTPTPSETYYAIVVPELTGATTNPAAGKHTVKEGDTFSFTLTLDADYDQSKPEVKAGDEVLVADANGKYTIPNVRGNLTITITGITLNNPTANAEVEQPVKVWAEGTTLHIYTEKRETIRLYTFSGQLLKQMDNAGRIAITGLPEGNYLIRIGNRTWKIAL